MKDNFSTIETQEEWLPVFLAKFGDLSSAFCILQGLDIKCQTVAIFIRQLFSELCSQTAIEDDMFQVNMF